MVVGCLTLFLLALLTAPADCLCGIECNNSATWCAAGECFCNHTFAGPGPRLLLYDVPYSGHAFSDCHRSEAVGSGPHSSGRLDSEQCWQAPLYEWFSDHWLQLRVGDGDTWVAGVGTKGRPLTTFEGWTTNHYTAEYRVMTLPGNGSELGNSSGPGNSSEWQDQGVFIGNTERYELVTNLFARPVLAQFVRIYPLVWSGNSPVLRAG
eukprot:1851187-Rhodomonas_salina.1